MCFLKISSGFSYYCLRERSLKLSSRMDLLLRRSFLCRCWYQTTPPRARAMSNRSTHMAIKAEDRISTSFMGMFMPSIFTLSPPMSLRITAFPISLVIVVIVLKCSVGKDKRLILLFFVLIYRICMTYLHYLKQFLF